MVTKSSAELREYYPLVSALAHETNEPICIIDNNKEDMVIMSMEAYAKVEAILAGQGKKSEQNSNERTQGIKRVSPEEAKLELMRLFEPR